MNFVSINGKTFPASEPLLAVNNRSYKWGDGLFETMKVHEGRILLEDLHFERLFAGLKMLLIQTGLEQQPLTDAILALCRKNNCTDLARVRLAVFRDETNEAGYTVEATPLGEESMQWDPRGLSLIIYPFARKSIDAFSNLKSANYLPYVMASMYATQNGCDDALVLNTNNAIADSSRANLFLVTNGELFTPTLHQGCVNGVMRRFVLDECKKQGWVVHQQEVTEADILKADEAFLTNAVQGICHVKRFKEKEYGSEKTFVIYRQLFSTI